MHIYQIQHVPWDETTKLLTTFIPHTGEIFTQILPTGKRMPAEHVEYIDWKQPTEHLWEMRLKDGKFWIVPKGGVSEIYSIPSDILYYTGLSGEHKELRITPEP